MKKIMVVVVCTLALALCTASAFAQADTLKQDYFANANTAGAPDATLRVSNPGTYANGNICAAFFVFYPNQELSECCSCLQTPDGLGTLSVDKDLTSNPLTGVTLTTGTSRSSRSPRSPEPARLQPSLASAWETQPRAIAP